MEEILIERGFRKEGQEYIRNNWTVRFDEDQIEIFNNPDKEEGFYYIDSLEELNIKDLLDDIDDIERNLL